MATMLLLIMHVGMKIIIMLPAVGLGTCLIRPPLSRLPLHSHQPLL